jgi:hypothetical protein
MSPLFYRPAQALSLRSRVCGKCTGVSAVESPQGTEFPLQRLYKTAREFRFGHCQVSDFGESLVFDSRAGPGVSNLLANLT